MRDAGNGGSLTRESAAVVAEGRAKMTDTFSDFIELIESPALKQIAAHWQRAKGTRKMPGWSDIKPAAIYRHLSLVWSYKYDLDKEEFTARLAGEHITQLFGKGFRGLPLSEAHPPEAFPWVYGICKRVVSEPALYEYRGQVFKQLGRVGLGERIMLPLSTDGLIGDGILGATEYNLTSGGSISAVAPSDEVERWFSLTEPS